MQVKTSRHNLTGIKAGTAGDGHNRGMSLKPGEQMLDLRLLPAKAKHRSLFKAWHDLPEGGALLLLSNEDLGGFYHQFACQFLDQFRWECVEQGPRAWTARICKGRFSDPGFVPPKRGASRGAPGPAPGPGGKRMKPLVLDVRPILEVGGVPCAAIDEAVANLLPSQKLVLLVPFQPQPLLAKLAREGFTHRSTQTEDGSWRVEFRKAEL